MSVTWFNHDVVALPAPHLRVKSLPLATGVTVQYVAQGEAGTPWDVPVVFVHGLSDSWRSFAPLLRLLQDQRTIALTQRGHGEATRPRHGYAAADFADDLAAFLDALRIPRAVLVGHSMGSAVVQRFAIDHPERVAGVVLFGANATWKGNPVLTEICVEVDAHLTDTVKPDFVRAFQHSDRVPDDRLKLMIAESQLVPVRVWHQAGHALLAVDFTAELSRITAPALIIWGMEDPLCGEAEQERLRALIPNAELLVYPDAGHNLHWEHPERFAVDLLDFLARID